MDTAKDLRPRQKRQPPRKRKGTAQDPHREAGAQPEISFGLLDSLIGFHLRLAQDASFREFSRLVGEAQLRPGRFAAMMIIHNNPGVNQAALSRAIARDKSTVTPLLQKLERQGLVARTPQPGDGRSHEIALTAEGEETLKALLRQAIEHDRRLDAIVGDRKADLIALLKRISQDLR